MSDEQRRLSDDRGSLGSGFEHSVAQQDRDLGKSFAPNQTLPQTPEQRDQQRLGESFADPNSSDDLKLGRAFEEENSRHPGRHQEPKKPHKPVNWRLLSICLVIALVVLLLIFVGGFLPRHRQDKRNADRATQEQTALPIVEGVRVAQSSGGGGLVVPGTTTPLTEAFIYARSNGYLKRRYVDIGDHVREGQLLAIVDSPDLDQQVDQAREQLRQAQSQLAQQQTQLALNKITNDRYRVLVAKGVFARQDGDQREADFRAQVANVAAAERNVEAFQANLRRVIALQGYERVTAPFTGIITERNVDVGSLISAEGTGQGAATGPTPMPGQTQAATSNNAGSSGNAPTAGSPTTGGGGGGPLFAMAQVQRLRILVSVPEGYAGSIRLKQPVVLHVQELPKSAFEGQVTRTAASIDQNTRTLLTEVQVDNHNGALMSGMYTVATFEAAKGPGPITITGDAVAVRSGQNVVAVIDGGKVHLQQVELGRDFGPVVEVLDGLHPGQTIASVITDDIREGAKVKVEMQKKQAGGAPSPPSQSAPPGGSSQYGDQSITDTNLQGQAAQQTKSKGQPQAKGGSSGGAAKP